MNEKQLRTKLVDYDVATDKTIYRLTGLCELLTSYVQDEDKLTDMPDANQEKLNNTVMFVRDSLDDIISILKEVAP